MWFVRESRGVNRGRTSSVSEWQSEADEGMAERATEIELQVEEWESQSNSWCMIRLNNDNLNNDEILSIYLFTHASCCNTFLSLASFPSYCWEFLPPTSLRCVPFMLNKWNSKNKFSLLCCVLWLAVYAPHKLFTQNIYHKLRQLWRFKHTSHCVYVSVGSASMKKIPKNT